MGVQDELLREKQVLKPAQEYMEPDSVGTTELADVGMTAADIADASIVATKIAAASCLATGAVTGGGGAALTLVPDGVFLELDGGVTPAKKVRIRAAGVTMAKLNGGAAGNGVIGGGGAPMSVNAAASGGLINTGGQVALKDNTITKAMLAEETKIKRISIELPAITGGGATDIQGLLSCPTGKTLNIVDVQIQAHVSPTIGTSAALKLINSDGGVDADLVVGFACPTLVADVPQALTLVAGAPRVLGAHDTLRAEILGVGAVGVQWTAPALTISYYES